MLAVEPSNGFSNALARNGIRVAALLALAGSGLGIYAILRHMASGIEAALIVSGFLFSIGILLTLSFLRNVPIQSLATACTVYYMLYLCAGVGLAAFRAGSGFDLFIYVVWFFPLLVLTKMINSVAIERVLGTIVLLAPFIVLAPLFPHLVAVLPFGLPILLAIMCLSYLCFGLMLNTFTRFREAYFIERERAAAFRVESEVLESISDCFISLNSEFKLIYLTGQC